MQPQTNSNSMSNATYELCERLVATPRDDIAAQRFLLQEILISDPALMVETVTTARDNIEVYINNGIGEGIAYDLIPIGDHDSKLVSFISDGRSRYIYALLTQGNCDAVGHYNYEECLAEILGLIKDFEIEGYKGTIKLMCHQRINGWVRTGHQYTDETELKYMWNGEIYRARDRVGLNTVMCDMELDDWIDGSSQAEIHSDRNDMSLTENRANHLYYQCNLSGSVTKLYFDTIESTVDILKHNTLLELVKVCD